jgi:hypothetical protein
MTLVITILVSTVLAITNSANFDLANTNSVRALATPVFWHRVLAAAAARPSAVAVAAVSMIF